MDESEKESIDGKDVDNVLAEYERAQEVGLHTDTLIYEVTAIVWGANTLLLGFVLEVDCNKSSNQKLVVLSSIVGILMSVYVPLIHHLLKKGQQIAYQVCRDIENSLPLPHRLHNKIVEQYPKWKPGRVAIWVLSVIFVEAWVYVISVALRCLCHCQ